MLDSINLSCNFWGFKGGFSFTAVLVSHENFFFFPRNDEILIDSISFRDLRKSKNYAIKFYERLTKICEKAIAVSRAELHRLCFYERYTSSVMNFFF